MAKHLLHAGLIAAIAALVLKALFMPPRLQAALHPGESAEIDGAVLVLKDFRVPSYPGGAPRQYISDVHIVSGSGKNVSAAHARISVNHPMRWNGWWIYQSACDAEKSSYTVLEAVRDPFLPLAAAAGILLLCGAALLCSGRSGCGSGTAGGGTATRFAAAARFACATATVMLPLWIAGRSLVSGEPPPALQSPLLVPHVGAYIVSYAILLFAAFGIGVRFVPFGFFLMTLALCLGALWGKICWGDWWQYDPKEMWSLATWLVFAAYFHFRRKAAVARFLLRFGAVMILLTLTWVNFSRFFRGLHSYA